MSGGNTRRPALTALATAPPHCRLPTPSQGTPFPKTHFFSTFFCNKLYKDGGYNYAAVRRWTTPKRLKSAGQSSGCLLDCDRIVIPVHQGIHWVCAVIDLQAQEIRYYDALLVRGCLSREGYGMKGGDPGSAMPIWPTPVCRAETMPVWRPWQSG